MSMYENLEELIAAAGRGDVQRVSSLMETPGIDVNTGIDSFSPPPLLAACRAGQLEVVRILLKHKDSQVNIVYGGETPLSAAAKHGYTELMKVLLEHGAVVDYVGDNPPRHSVRVRTALMAAARNGQYEAAVLLLQNRAKVDGIQSEFSGVTPLLLAAGKGHANLVQLFLDNDVILQGGRGIPPLAAAFRGGHTECVMLLLNNGADINESIAKEDLPQLLFAACRAGQLEVVRILLKHKDIRVNFVFQRVTPLSAAAEHGHTEIMKLLLEHGAGVDYVGDESDDPYVETALVVAARYGQYEAAVLLLQNGAKVDGTQSKRQIDTPLSIAAGNGHANLVRLLLENGADVQGQNFHPPLHAACQAGHLEVVRVLLKHKDIRVNYLYEGETPLSAAAKHGYKEIVKLLLEHGAGVDYIGDNCYSMQTALMVAADNGQYEAAVVLLQNGAKVDGIEPRFKKDTPLSLAAGNGHANLVQLLLDNGANIQGGEGLYPLTAAHRRGHTDCVTLLVENGADINKSIAKGDLPQLLLAACRAGQLEVVRVLLKHKDIRVNLVYQRETPLSAAAEHGYTEIMKLLLEHGAGVDYIGDNHATYVETALMYAARNGQYETAVLLLQLGAKVSGVQSQSKRRKDTPLSLAAGNGHANLVQLLLDNDASVKGHGFLPPLLAACRASQLDAVRVLLKHKDIQVNIVYKKETPLSAAAKHGYTEIMKLLLEHGAGVDYVGDGPDGDGVRTALMVATQNNQYEAAELLLQNGAKVDGVQSGLAGGPPLSIAAGNGNSDLVQLLLANSADVRSFQYALTGACRGGHTECARLLIQRGAAVDEDGGAPLTSAAANGHTECTRLLLEYGANVNLRNDLKNMYSPLMHASKYGHIDVVQLLLEHGAEVNASNNDGNTALSLARREKHVAITELLLKHGAKEEGSELDSEASSTEESVEDRKEERGDDHVENSEKEADAEDPSEAEHLAAVDRAMKEKGTLDHTLAHGVLVGPARSGKSSLMTRLVGEMPSPTSPSTGVAEQAIQVGVKKSYSIALGVLDSIWFKLLYDEEAIRLMTLASHNIPIQPAASLTDHTPSPPTTLLQSDPENELPTVALPTPLLHGEPENVASAKSVIVSLPAGYVAPMGVFKAAIRGRGLEGLRRHFENSWSFYLTDTGGQIEFQEMIPLLVSGPSVFFITFRLDQGLHQRFTIEYHLPDGGRSEPYQSTLTVVEAILQTLASIASMGTFVYKGSQIESIPLKPKVIIVGTHKDKLDPATADSDIKKIDQYLQEVIKCTSHYQDLVEFATKYQMIYTVNNLSEDDSDFKKIRSGVERVVCRPKFKMSFPSHWLIFSLVVRQEMIKDSIISFEQCYAIAQDCGIADHEELGHALWFLHTKIGLIRHFPTPGLRDLVIRHPQILFDMVTKLIVNTFTFENVGKPLSTEFEKKGIFTLEDFKQIDRASTPLLPPEKLLQLLEHLRIVAPFEEKGQWKYFLPCVLAHSEAYELPSSPQSSDVPSLLITFECGYCPKGLYGALMQCLLTNVVGSKFKWELMTDEIFRDQVTFYVSPYDTITLKIYPKYLEIIHSCTTALKRTRKVENVCNKVRLSVEESIRKVSSDMKLTSCAKHSLSFYCSHPDCTPKEAHPATKISEDEDGSLCNLWCKNSGKMLLSRLPAGYSVWFGREREETHHSVAASQRDLAVTRPKRALAATAHPDHTTTTVGDEPPTEDQDLTSSRPKKQKIEGEGSKGRRAVVPSVQWNLGNLHTKGVTGEGVVIAILDGGVDTGHELIDANRLVKFDNSSLCWTADYVQPLSQPTSKPYTQHGTAVAAVAGCGLYRNQDGQYIYAGVAPGAKFLICRVSPSDGDNNFDPVAVQNALQDLVKYKNEGKPLDIVCMSFRIPACEEVERILSELARNKVVCVAAAGNSGHVQKGAFFPASNSNVLSVGALTPEGRDSGMTPDSGVDVCAPGEDIVVPVADSKDQTGIDDGTSYAAPMVAGFLALLVQRTGKMTNNIAARFRDINFLRTLFATHWFCQERKLDFVEEFLEQFLKRDAKEVAVKIIRKQYRNFEP